MVWLIAALHFALLHGPEGGLFWVNLEQVTSLRAPIPSDLGRSFPRGTQCVVVTSNAKFMAVVETCEQVFQLIAAVR